MIPKVGAIAKLERQLKQIDALMRQPWDSPEFTRWHRNTEVALENIFGSSTRHLKDFRQISYTLPMISTSTPHSAFEQAYQSGLEDARQILRSLIEEVGEYWKESPKQNAQSDKVELINHLCNRFHLVARQLRMRHAGRSTLSIEDEYDVQDLFHALLLVDFEDVRDEEWTPSYAGGSSRMDFLLKQERIVIEVKKTRSGLAEREIGDELLIDIGRYKAHPDFKTLICFVYDPEGKIANPRGLETDLSKKVNELEVCVFV